MRDTEGDRPLIWIDGAMLPRSQAKISVFDHGLLYGDGCFEGIRAYGGRIFKCRSHIDRLYRSADKIRLEIPYSKDEIDRVMRECLKANDIKDGYIRLVVTRGVGTLGLHPFRCPRPGVICIADSISLYPPEMYETGMPIIVAKRPRIPVDCLDPRIKSLNYLNNILAKIEAIDAGVLEALMLNKQGEVCECTGDNVFAVKNGAIATPDSESGLLEGITRRFVIDLCKKLGLPIEERILRLEDVTGADEVFLTGTAAEIIAVKSIDGNPVGDGKGEGPITRRLREGFREVLAQGAPED
ncbi:MAG: branched-chain-amino-acid transaminase [Phycisphaeraceae bacterium]|nr:branched-chain-amino-acid transaminase [Phycisphaeraceae bacterium]MCB9847730.1 branched-chain-amino-acid transaminase [Phycisphaeraceae bacterium]